jgi:uncharacterized protein YxjI
MNLANHQRLLVSQKFEMGEMFGFETRNRYSILTENKEPIAYAAEQKKGILGFFLRQTLGHWFKFDVHFFDNSRRLILIATHPFRWYFTRIDLKDADGRPIGAIQKRFALFTKRFDVENAKGMVIFEVASPIWKLWTFPFKSNGKEVAFVRKKWSGLLSEAFTDRDNFMVEFAHPKLSEDERRLVTVSAVFIDLLYFEQKQ